MSDKRRKKQEKRQRRAVKKERQQGARVDKTIECPNCGDRYRPDPQPEAFHRAGPCDCDPATRRAMDSFLDKLSVEYENSPTGKIACRTCATMHEESKQYTIFIEGRLVFDGCDHCVKTRDAELQILYEVHREKWFGPRPKPVNKFLDPFFSVPVGSPDASQQQV